MIAQPRASVTLGGLPLLEEGEAVLSEDGYTLAVMGEDTTFGNPQPVVTTLYSMLSDGSIVSRDRDENRQPVLLVEIAAAHNDGNALAKGEAALMAVCHQPGQHGGLRRRIELVWTPPQAGAEPVVFDVVDSSTEHLFDEMDELTQRRTFRVPLQALPYGRRSIESVVAAVEVPAVPTTVSIDTCDSTTNWTAGSTGPSVTLSQTGGYVQASGPWSGLWPAGFYVSLVRTAAVDFSATEYLVVEWQGSATNGGVDSLVCDEGAKVYEQVMPDGWTKTYFRVDGAVTELTFRARAGNLALGGGFVLRIRDLTRTDAPPIAGSGRQSFRNFDVGGTATTQGSIEVTGTAALGDVGIYTFPNGAGYQPHLSPYQTDPVSRTADAATLSGGRNLITAGAEWVIPAENMPVGEFVVVARMRDTSGGVKTFTWSSRSRMGGVDVGPDAVTDMSFDFAVASQWYMVTLGVIDLPVTPVSSAGDVRLAMGTGVGTLEVDEVLIFNTAGSLTMLTDVTKERVIVRAPSLHEEAGSIWVGDEADGSDWYGASSLCQARAPGGHNLEPGQNNLYVYTTGQVNPVVTSRHFDRFQHHPVMAEN